MKTAARKLIEFLDSKVPRRAVLLAPGDCFYGHSFDVPAELADSEIAAFAELALEGVAPFPLEQLGWGFLHAPDERRVFVYAAPFVRLRHEGVDDLEIYFHALPAFITRFGAKFESRTITFVAHRNALSALFYEADSVVPSRIFSQRISVDGEPTDEALGQAREQMLARLRTSGYQAEETIWRVLDARVDDDNLVFEHQIIDIAKASSQPVTTSVSLKEKQIWEMDLRGSEYSQRTLKSRLNGARVWTVLMAAVWTLGLLILLQVGLFAFDQWNDARFARFESQTEAVARIESNHSLLERIESFAQQELKPFAMLEALNFHRPDGIFFRRCQSRSWNRLEVEGQGNSIDQVNHYFDQLRSANQIQDIQVQSIQSRSSVAPFDVVFIFNDLPHLNWPAEPAPQASRQEPASDNGANTEPRNPS